ncbi:MAG: hypothetical protein GWN76_10590, partial [candidate division Zixibacteria bacterium]|nr:hypothetical protein [Phycisphaerae bacterium]NIR64434.1 hypothetical protein [candidate division Zixibacteria bacterium]NIU14432.1 hypothetical protein [candidate division Zixibacteria bacterium]
NNQVPGNQDSGKVSNPLTQPDGDSDVTSTQVTTAESQPDADVQALKEKLEALEDKSEKDIRAMKSSLQRRESELTKEWQEQERLYQDKIRQLELAGLDDEARAEYERNFTTERLTQLEQQLNQAQVELDQRDAFNAALTYFTQAGIAPSSLDAENGYEALIQSGWDALKSERDALKEQIAKGEVKPEPKKDD